MNERELTAFRAVADTGSFTAAAVQLGLTQPAVSKRIASLEAHCQARLLDRVGRRLLLTAAGQALLGEADKVLAALADAQRAVDELSARPPGPLSLATSHHIGLHRLAPVLRRLKQAQPDLRLDVRFEDSEDAAELVARGQVELAVVTLDPAGYARLDARPVWHDPLTFVVAADHPLAHRRRISLERLAAHDAILPGRKTYTGRIVADLFARHGVQLEAALTTNYLETIGMLVSAGFGWSMLPATLSHALQELRTGERVERTLGVVLNPARTTSASAGHFLGALRDFADRDLRAAL